jgi:hypothetical protein
MSALAFRSEMPGIPSARVLRVGSLRSTVAPAGREQKKAALPVGSAADSKQKIRYWLGPLLAASAWAIRFAISAFTASRLKLAPRCIGG